MKLTEEGKPSAPIIPIRQNPPANSDGNMVYGAHDVSAFTPLKDPNKKARDVRKLRV